MSPQRRGIATFYVCHCNSNSVLKKKWKKKKRYKKYFILNLAKKVIAKYGRNIPYDISRLCADVILGFTAIFTSRD